jgi:hypothetical protein
MAQFRITKFNPANRLPDGTFKEWTSFSQVGSSVTLEKYEEVELNYIDSVIQIFTHNKFKSFKIAGLENRLGECQYQNGDDVDLINLKKVIKAILRDEYCCRLENNRSFIHFGPDYHMYVCAPEIPEFIKKKIGKRSLFVEPFKSPIPVR